MKHIAISIEYAGLTLPVVKNEEGIELVPLKPVADLFGLKWETQRQKVGLSFYSRHLGVCLQKAWVATPHKGGAFGEMQEQICIRLDRVAAFLMTINPDRVRAAGNITGADFLEARLNEWSDALHDYETLGAAVNERHASGQVTLRAANAAVKLIRAKAATTSKADRGLLDALLVNLSRENGIAYQPELLPE